ncbi:MAG: tetratricopeptide repeat protein [Bacteroidota bacterium]|nr:tetratricopeptide repeat protein [Bacteroidota bacterium]MDP4195511.1 tetratricopeptide repeat protein [Bacteroidota bacterium]
MDNLEIIFSSAYEMFLQKRYIESLEKLEEFDNYLSQNYSDDWKISSENLRGFVYLALDNIDQARICFEKSLNIDQNSSQACAGLAEIFLIKNQDKEAKTMFEYAAITNPENQFAVKGLTKVNELLNLPSDHNSLISKEEVKLPDFRNVIFESGELFSNGQYEQAIDGISSVEKKVLNDLVDLRNLLTEMLNMKATAYLNLNQLEEAKESFERALNISPDSSIACWGLAEIFYRTKMYEEAKTMFEWAVKNDNTNLAAEEGLAKTNSVLESFGNNDICDKPTLKLASGKTIIID